MSAVEAVETQRSLEELAEIANREHVSVAHALLSAVQHAVAAGQAIYEAHEQIPEKRPWEQWVRSNLRFDVAMAMRYERLFFYRDKLPSECFEPFVRTDGQVIQPSASRAYVAYVKGLPPLRPAGQHYRQHDESTRAEACRLREEGLSHREIAELVGASKAQVRRWTTPGLVDEERARKRADGKRMTAARRALARERDLAAARAYRGGLSEAYANTRKSLQALQQDLDRHEDSVKVRREINALISELHAVEDHIVRVLKMGGDS